MHKFSLRIYFEDTDAGGIVYHANYLNFCERARTEMLRELGFESSDALKTGQGFVVAKAAVKYIRSAILDDRIEVRSAVKEITPTRVILQQDCYRIAKDGDAQILTECEITLAYVDFGKGALKIPMDIIQKLESL